MRVEKADNDACFRRNGSLFLEFFFHYVSVKWNALTKTGYNLSCSCGSGVVPLSRRAKRRLKQFAKPVSGATAEAESGTGTSGIDVRTDRPLVVTWYVAENRVLGF